MKNFNIYLAVGLLIILALPMKAQSAPSADTLQVQGFIKLSTGVAVTDNVYNMAFAVMQGGTCIWGTALPVTVTNGLFSQALGGGATSVDITAHYAAMGGIAGCPAAGTSMSSTLFLNGPVGEVSVVIFAIDPIMTFNPVWTVSVDAVPTSMIAETALSVAPLSLNLGDLSLATWTQTVAGTNKIVVTDGATGLIPAVLVSTLNQNTTGTSSNITATTNATLTSLTALASASSLTTVGTIGVGVWNGTPVTVPFGGTGLTTYTAAGAIPVSTGATTLSALQVGTPLQVLAMNAGGTAPVWSNIATVNAAGSAAGINSDIVQATALTTANALTSATSLASLPALTSVGTIGVGTWQGTAVDATRGGTGIDTHLSNGIPHLVAGVWSVSALVGADIPTLNQSTTGNATTATTATNIAGGAGGSVPFQSGAGATSLLANGTVGQILTSAGTTLAPTWATNLAGNAATATTSTNIAGGLGGSIPFQTAAATTSLLANGAAGQILTSAGTTLAPTWSTNLAGNAATATTATTATNVAGGAAGSVPFQTGAGATSLLAVGTAGQVLTVSGGAPVWSSPVVNSKPSLYVWEDFLTVNVAAIAGANVVTGLATAFSTAASGATLAIGAYNTSHVGILNLVGGAVAAKGVGVILCGTSAAATVSPNVSFETTDNWTFQTSVAPSTIALTTGSTWIGLLGATSFQTVHTTGGTNAFNSVMFEVINANTNNVNSFTESKIGTTANAGSTTTWTAGTFANYMITYTGSTHTVTWFVNGIAQATTINLATSIPTQQMLCPAVWQSEGAVARTLSVDYLGYTQTMSNANGAR